MTTDLRFNIEELLAPVSEDAPAGVDLREDSAADAPYYQIKDARNNARAIERNSFPGDENEDHLEKQHWKLILKEAPKALKQSKDLEIAAWLTEALIREDGFAGLKQGFDLIQGLVDNYWDNLYPMPDEDGISTRVAVLVGLNGINNTVGTLVAPINTAAITSDGEYSYWSYLQAQELEKVKDNAEKQKKIKAGSVPMDTIKAAVKPSQSDFYIQLNHDLEHIIATFATLTDTLDEKCGDDTPPSSNIRKSLENTLKALNVIAKDIINPEIAPEGESETEYAGETEATTGTAPTTAEFKATGNIKGRLEAFKTLQTVADFFKRTEPHSPIGFSIERLVRWGDMSLPELLQELVPDAGAKDYYEKLVGIKPPEPMGMGGAPMQQPGMPPQGGMDPNMQDPYNGGNGGQYNDPYSNNNDQFNNGGMGGDYDNPLFK